MIKTLLQARQFLDAVGWPYAIEEVLPEEQLAVRAKLGVPEGVGSLSYIMLPAPHPEQGRTVLVFDGEVNYAGVWVPKLGRFVPSASRSNFRDFYQNARR